MQIRGYKSFDLNNTNMHGQEFVAGNHYHQEGEIVYGPHGNGFHFARNLEDTIRFSGEGIVRNVSIAEVIGSGVIKEGCDHYYGYYDLYCCSDLEVIRYLTREEIIEYALKLPELRMLRFVSLFKLTEEEQLMFEGKHYSVSLALDYYQRNISEAYSNEYRQNKVYQKIK